MEFINISKFKSASCSSFEAEAIAAEEERLVQEETQWSKDSLEEETPTKRKISDNSTAPTLIEDEEDDTDVIWTEKKIEKETEKDDEIVKFGAKKIVIPNFEKEKKNRKGQLIVPLATELLENAKVVNNTEKEIEKEDAQFLSRISLKITEKEKKQSEKKKVLTMKEWLNEFFEKAEQKNSQNGYYDEYSLKKRRKC